MTGFVWITGMALWAAAIGLPMVWVLGRGFWQDVHEFGQSIDWLVVWNSFLKAAGIAAVSVILGFGPARLLAESRWKGGVFVFLLLPLVLPSYMLYYAWNLMLDPTTGLGQCIGQVPGLAGQMGGWSAWIVLCLWYWPIAAMLMGHGFRGLGTEVFERARLEAGGSRRFWIIVLPLMLSSIVPAFVVCMMMAMAEFTTFHLSAVRTIGTELAVVYELTGSSAAVARAGWPMLIAALAAGWILSRAAIGRYRGDDTVGVVSRSHSRSLWGWFAGLCLMSWIIPASLMAGFVREIGPFREYFVLHA
ncbi:MAG: hypothetical protein ABFD91_04520, partial [Anaerohalosphaeraceae bacterium]